jgi:hypothetical protein
MVIALQARLQIVQHAEVDPEATEAVMAIARPILQAVAIAVAAGQLGAAVQGHAGPEAVHPSLTHQLRWFRSHLSVKQWRFKQLSSPIFEIAFFVTPGMIGKVQRKNCMIFSKQLASKFGSVRKTLDSAYR